MSKVKTMPLKKIKLDLDTATRNQLKRSTKEEAQVVVQCAYTPKGFWEQIRIWNSTYLIPRGHGDKSKLLHCENISVYPTWTAVEAGKTMHFSLFFSALPAGCKSFDLIEVIPENGGFDVRNIQRNNSDIYHVVID